MTVSLRAGKISVAEVQALILLVLFAIFVVRAFRARNLPRVGGKIGRRRTDVPAPPFPEGISASYVRADTLFEAKPNAPQYSSLKAFLRNGAVALPTLMHVYRMAGCRTEIELPATVPNYDRIDVADAVALLRELPDVRLVRRLQLSDEPCFLDPWVRTVAGRQYFLLGNASKSGLIVLYQPDRGHSQNLRMTLLHEWLHLVAYQSAAQIRRFKRANAFEQPVAARLKTISFGDPRTPIFEAWCELGEKIFGYEETVAREAALAAPVHTMILWGSVEKILIATPLRLRSTRFEDLMGRGGFINGEIAPQAAAARAKWWWPF
jgi:hypothetical protein